MIKEVISSGGFYNSCINNYFFGNYSNSDIKDTNDKLQSFMVNDSNKYSNDSRATIDNFVRKLQYQIRRINGPLNKCLDKDYTCPISRLSKDEIKSASILTCCGTLEESRILKNWLRGNGNNVCPFCRSYARYLTISTSSNKSLIETLEEFMINIDNSFRDNNKTNTAVTKQKLIIIFCPQKLRNDITFIIEKLNINISWMIIDVENQIRININEMLEKYDPEALVIGKLNSRSNFIIESLRKKSPNNFKVTFC